MFGNLEKGNIVDIVEKYSSKNKQQEIGKIEEEKNFQDFGTVTYTEKTRAVIKVQDGCNNFCSYCIIPYAKGRVRSRKIESVLQEIGEIVKKGIKEVVITGIHVASYGKDFEDGTQTVHIEYEGHKDEFDDGKQNVNYVSTEEAMDILDSFGNRSSSEIIGKSDYILIYDADKKLVINGEAYLPSGYMVMKSSNGLRALDEEDIRKVISELGSRMTTLAIGEYRIQAYRLG